MTGQWRRVLCKTERENNVLYLIRQEKIPKGRAAKIISSRVGGLRSLGLHLGGYYSTIFLPEFCQPVFQNQRKMPKITVSLKAELTLCAQAFPQQSRVPSPGRTAAPLHHPPHSSACSCCHSLPRTGSLDPADPKVCCCPQDRQVPTLPPVPPSAKV